MAPMGGMPKVSSACEREQERGSAHVAWGGQTHTHPLSGQALDHVCVHPALLITKATGTVCITSQQYTSPVPQTPEPDGEGAVVFEVVS